MKFPANPLTGQTDEELASAPAPLLIFFEVTSNAKTEKMAKSLLHATG